MSRTPAGRIAPGTAKTESVETSSGSLECKYGAGYIVFYHEAGLPLADIVALLWIYAREPCSGDTEPLLKVVAGVPGDEVTVSTRGVAVNGRVL